MLNKKILSFGNCHDTLIAHHRGRRNYFILGFITGFIVAFLILFIISIFILYP